MKRTDNHKPSNILPADYEYVGQEYIEVEGIFDAYILSEMRATIKAHMDRTGGHYSDHEHGGNCMVCGASAIYTVLFYHAKTNSYVRMGQDCAQKCEMGNKEDFRTFRTTIKDILARRAGMAKAKLILQQAELDRAYSLYEEVSKHEKSYPNEELTVHDMVTNLIKYGSLSEKQISFLKTLLSRIDNRSAIEAKRAEEKEAAKPCPEGRVLVKGEILSTKLQNTDFGNILKMLVKAEEGFTLWGTVPSSLIINEPDGQRPVRRGDKIQFNALLVPSKSDTKFGFFKRPTKAVVLV